MSNCILCSVDCVKQYIMCNSCNNKIHYVCLHDAKLIKSKFANNNTPPNYLLDMFDSPYFNFTCNSCSTLPTISNNDTSFNDTINNVFTNLNELIAKLKLDLVATNDTLNQHKDTITTLTDTINNLVESNNTLIKSNGDMKVEYSNLLESNNSLIKSNDNMKVSNDKISAYDTNKKTYADSLNIKSLAKQITLETERSRSLVIFNVDNIDKLDNLLCDINITSKNVTKQKLNTKNIDSYKITFKSAPSSNHILDFHKLPDRNAKYSNIFIRPDMSYQDREKRLILNIGAKTINNQCKCIFNINTLQYELRNSINNGDTTKIDWKNDVNYTDVQFKKWSKQLNTSIKSKVNSNVNDN